MIITVRVPRITDEREIPRQAWAKFWAKPPTHWTLGNVSGVVVRMQLSNSRNREHAILEVDVADTDLPLMLGQPEESRKRGKADG